MAQTARSFPLPGRIDPTVGNPLERLARGASLLMFVTQRDAAWLANGMPSAKGRPEQLIMKTFNWIRIVLLIHASRDAKASSRIDKFKEKR